MNIICPLSNRQGADQYDGVLLLLYIPCKSGLKILQIRTADLFHLLFEKSVDAYSASGIVILAVIAEVAAVAGEAR